MNSSLVGVASTARSLSLQVRPIRHGTGSGRPHGPPGSGHVQRLHCTWLHSPIGRSGLHSCLWPSGNRIPAWLLVYPFLGTPRPTPPEAVLTSTATSITTHHIPTALPTPRT